MAAPPPSPDLLAAVRAAVREELEPELRLLRDQVDALRRNSPPQLVTVAEAAKLLGLSVRTVSRHIKSGEIPTRRIGRSVRVDLGQLRPLDATSVAELAYEARSGGA